MTLSPSETIKTMERVISTASSNDRVKAWAKRRLKKARTEQLEQETAPMMRLQTERRV